MCRATRFAFAAAVCLVLAAPPSWAAGPRTSPSAPALISRLWSLLNVVWSAGGCIADPHGGCAPQQAQPTTDQLDGGCIADPSGGCAPRS